MPNQTDAYLAQLDRRLTATMAGLTAAEAVRGWDGDGWVWFWTEFVSGGRVAEVSARLRIEPGIGPDLSEASSDLTLSVLTWTGNRDLPIWGCPIYTAVGMEPPSNELREACRSAWELIRRVAATLPADGGPDARVSLAGPA